jgi:hypothetical protein
MPGLVDALPISPSVIISIQQVVGYPPSPHDAALSALAPAKYSPCQAQPHQAIGLATTGPLHNMAI